MNPQRTNRFLRALARFFLMALGYALCVPLLEWSFEAHVTLRSLVSDYFIALAYAISIGALLSATLGILWQRSCAWSIGLRWPVRALAVAGGTAIGCLVAGLAPLAALGPGYHYWPSFIASFKISLTLSTAAVAFAVNYERMRSRLQVSTLELKNKELERQRALKLATDARLSSLESRMRPHFLFNTLNAIASLVELGRREQAIEMLERLNAILHRTLRRDTPGRIRVAQELELLDDYLAIEQARLQGVDRVHRVELREPLAGGVAQPVLIGLRQLLPESAGRGAMAAFGKRHRREGPQPRRRAGNPGGATRAVGLPLGARASSHRGASWQPRGGGEARPGSAGGAR